MGEPAGTDRILTIPNLISFLRIALIPRLLRPDRRQDTTQPGLVLFVIVVGHRLGGRAWPVRRGRCPNSARSSTPSLTGWRSRLGLIAPRRSGDAFPLWAALADPRPGRRGADRRPRPALEARRADRRALHRQGRDVRVDDRRSPSSRGGTSATCSRRPTLVVGWAFYAAGIVEYYVATVLYVGDLRRAWRARDRRPARRPERGRPSCATCYVPAAAHAVKERSMEFPEDLRLHQGARVGA